MDFFSDIFNPTQDPQNSSSVGYGSALATGDYDQSDGGGSASSSSGSGNFFSGIFGNMSSSGAITGGLGLVGAGIGLYGTIGAMDAAKQASQVSGEIAGQEEAINATRRQQMNLMAERQNIENYRNVQRTRAMGMAAAVNQGAQFGSGIAGAQGAESAEGAQNTRNIDQNRQIGNKIFGYTDTIDSLQQQLAGLQGTMATDQGIMGIGRAVMGAAGPLGNLFG